MKIIINNCYGGFNISNEALALYTEREGTTKFNNIRSFERNDPILVEIVEQLGKAANGLFSNLKVVEIPDDVKWQIQEYDGNEWVAEEHRTWS